MLPLPPWAPTPPSTPPSCEASLTQKMTRERGLEGAQPRLRGRPRLTPHLNPPPTHPPPPNSRSIGWNPTFDDVTARTAEPWILAPPDALPAAFWGETLRLVVVAYLRPEAAFESVDKLVKQIHADADVARAALAHPALAAAANDPFLRPEA